MSLRESIREEFVRAPVTVAATVVGVLVAGIALLVAWLQYAGQPVSTPAAAISPNSASGLRLSNLLLVASFFLAASFSAASLIRFLGRTHPFPAAALSVLAAVISSFSTLVVLHLTPPRHLTPDTLRVATDAVFYGTLVIFVAFNGRPILNTLTEPLPGRAPESNEKASEQRQLDSFGVLVGSLLMLAIWGGLVSAGLSKLTTLFLT